VLDAEEVGAPRGSEGWLATALARAELRARSGRDHKTVGALLAEVREAAFTTQASVRVVLTSMAVQTGPVQDMRELTRLLEQVTI
jgi:hypothetical protein